MYSDIWLPERLDSLKCDSSLFSMRLNFSDAMSLTLRCVWIVSSWSRHHSSSSMVSPASRTYCSSPGTMGFCSGVAAARFDLEDIGVRLAIN